MGYGRVLGGGQWVAKMNDFNKENVEWVITTLDKTFVRLLLGRAVLRILPHAWEETEDESHSLLLEGLRFGLLMHLNLNDKASGIPHLKFHQLGETLTEKLYRLENSAELRLHARAEAAIQSLVAWSALHYSLEHDFVDHALTLNRTASGAVAVSQLSKPVLREATTQANPSAERLWQPEELPRRTDECFKGMSAQLTHPD